MRMRFLLVFLEILLLMSVAIAVRAEIRLDKSVRIEVAKGYPRFNAKTGDFVVAGTVENNATTAIKAPIAVAVGNIKPAHSSLVLLNADGVVADGNAYHVVLKKGQLAAGVKLAFTLTFGYNRMPNRLFVSALEAAIKKTFVLVTPSQADFKFQYRVVQLPVNNQIPLANAGADKSVGVRDVVRLNGIASSDKNHDALKYMWTLKTVPGSKVKLLKSTVAATDFIPDIAGHYVAQLVVNDGYVQSVPDTVNITVKNGHPANNHNPVITSYAPNSATATTSFTYEINATDVDKDKLTYTLTSAPSGMAIGVDHAIRWSVPNRAHEHIPVSFKVTDGKGGQAVQNFSIHILPCACNK